VSEPAAESLVAMNNVTTILGGVVVHRHINLDVKAGEVLAIVGGSGSGKTTLLRLMLGLEFPSEGEVRVLGLSLRRGALEELEQVRYRWGVLFQQGALFSALDVLDNLALPLRELRSVPEDLVRPLAMLKLKQVGLKAEDATKMPSELSGGMVKRASLARSLVLEPQLLFLDEPTAGLDPQSSKDFVKLTRDLRAELDLTVIMVTHDVDSLLALADRVAVLADQTLVAVGPLAEVSKMDHPFIKSFFLGHVDRCTYKSVRDYRDSLDKTMSATTR
jgi:phospholipid/cholesterol/gamma-HCH transport system ATP-binding protein